jgi:hypothetical protein
MGKQPTEAPVSIRRGNGHGTLAKVLRVIGGDPFWSQVATANAGVSRQAERVSDRAVRALKPGNAGGAKDPDFWCAFEEVEDR